MPTGAGRIPVDASYWFYISDWLAGVLGALSRSAAGHSLAVFGRLSRLWLCFRAAIAILKQRLSQMPSCLPRHAVAGGIGNIGLPAASALPRDSWATAMPSHALRLSALAALMAPATFPRRSC